MSKETKALMPPKSPKSKVLEEATAKSIFDNNDAYKQENLEQLTLPPIIKPKDFPPQGSLIGRIVSIQSYEFEDKKRGNKYGALLIMDNLKGFKYALPVTAVFESTLKVQNMQEGKPTCEYIGKIIRVVSRGLMPSKTGKKDWWNFDVFLVKEDVKK